MKKLILIVFLTSGIWSCGTLKKNKESTDKEETENINMGSNRDKWTSSNDFSLEPVDLSKPITFTNSKGEKQVFENSKVIYNNTHTIEKVKDTTSVKKELKEETSKKEVERDNTMLILGVFGIGFLFLFLILIFIVVYFSSKIKV